MSLLLILIKEVEGKEDSRLRRGEGRGERGEQREEGGGGEARRVGEQRNDIQRKSAEVNKSQRESTEVKGEENMIEEMN